MILCDKHVRQLCQPSGGKIIIWGSLIFETNKPLLSPFSEGVQGGGVVSFGGTHAGYDLRLGGSMRIFKNKHGEVVSPKRMKEDLEYQHRIFDFLDDLQEGHAIQIEPGGYILGYSVERFSVPPFLKGTCVGKSTFARCGIHVNTTPAEPGWEGHLTIEVANHLPSPVEVYVGEGIAQVEFHVLSGIPEQTYADKEGKYQDQPAQPVTARVKT